MSTSSVTESGITLSLVPPWTTVGAMVSWVQAWNIRPMPSGSPSTASSNRAGSSSGRGHLLRQRHPVEEATPHVVDPGLGPVLGQAMDDLGGRDQRVVGLVRLGGVTGHPATVSRTSRCPSPRPSPGARVADPGTGKPPDSVIT